MIYRYNSIAFIFVLLLTLCQCEKDEPAANIISFSPLSGGQGTIVEIIGSNFSNVPTENIVSFNGSEGKVVSSTSTLIKAEVPAGATTGPIKITRNGKSSSTTIEYEVTSWTKKASFPGTITQSQVSFVINDKLYFGVGYETNELWEYDPATNQWTRKADFTGDGRLGGAVGFSLNGKGYIGLGYNTTTTFLNDLWEYDPAANSWTKKAAVYRGSSYAGFASFTLNDIQVVGLGVSDGYGTGTDDLSVYDPAQDKWLVLGTFPGEKRESPISFSYNNKGYIGLGNYVGYNAKTVKYFEDLWEYDNQTKKWRKHNNFAFLPLNVVAYFALNGKLNILTTSNDFTEYDVVTEDWKNHGRYNGDIDRIQGFNIGDKGYIGLGIAKELWLYNP